MKATAQKRNLTLDHVRGIAVLLMIIAHVTVFINNNHNQILGGFARIVDIIAFTIFLSVSGAVAYLVYIKGSAGNEKNGQLITRAIKLLLVYYLVSLVAILPELGSDFSGKLLQVLVFIRVPSYSDLLIPFIIYSLSLIPFKKFYLKAAGNIRLLLLAGIITYFAGWLLYFLPVSPNLAVYLSFFSGHADWFRYPLLQYFPVFLLGMYWGKMLHDGKLSVPEIFVRGLVCSLIFQIITATVMILFVPLTDLLQRWPPGPVFLFAGLLAFSIFFLILSFSRKRIPDILAFTGENAFAFYFLHIILLYLYHHYINIEVADMLPVTVCLLIILGICYLFIKVFQRLRLKL